MTGTNYARESPAYADEAGAVALLKANGGVEGILTRYLGAPISIGGVQEGDVVTADFEHGITAGMSSSASMGSRSHSRASPQSRGCAVGATRAICGMRGACLRGTGQSFTRTSVALAFAARIQMQSSRGP